jgi:hypothetical protein
MPMRLDMWVLAMLAVDRWGLRSLKTACAFALWYLFDSTFGFLGAGAYGFALAVQTLQARPLRLPWHQLVPLAAVALWQRWVFGSFISPAAAHYMRVQLGFLPISPVSLFWPIALLLAWATAVFVLHKEARASRLGLMLCLLAVAQLTYFFGRSHDHNLLNVAAVWVFPVFLAIDQCGPWLRARAAVGTAIIAIFAVMGARQWDEKLARAKDLVSRGIVLEEHSVEKIIEGYRPIATPNLMLLVFGDAYFNYRLGLPQRGFFSPFDTNIFLDDTARFLDEELRKGTRMLSHEGALPMWIGDLNQNSLGIRFAVYRSGTVFEVRRANHTAPAATAARTPQLSTSSHGQPSG